MYNNEEKVFIWLTLAGVTTNKQNKLVEHYDSILDIRSRWQEDKGFLENLVSSEHYKKANSITEKEVDKFIEKCNREKIVIVTIASATYPNQLRDITEPPTILFCLGNIHLLKSPCLAIVGSRRMTKYGEEVTEKFAKEIAMEGITIVSGLADGVDSKAHSATLAVKGKTIAVLGGGLHEVYPATNIKLAQSIIDNNGLIISEYLPDEKPRTFYFPIRNRIIAGLSQGVLITEATQKSGSMHTKQYALDFGKDLYVIPARITDIYSAGCNETIRDLQGCMVLSPKDILKDYKVKTTSSSKSTIQLTVDETMIVGILATDEVHYDEIQKKSKLATKELSTLLLRMEMRGILTKLPGNYYRMATK